VACLGQGELFNGVLSMIGVTSLRLFEG
jgi:hypothetical protein